MAVETKAADEIVRTIEASQYGAFAATGRTDERSDRVLLHRYGGVPDGLECAVVKIANMAVVKLTSNHGDPYQLLFAVAQAKALT